MRVGLATLQSGRHTHLRNQAEAVSRLGGLARYLVVSMDATVAPPGAEVLHLTGCDPDRLPLAAARNAAMRALDDCDLVILMDVDCVPDRALLDAYVTAAAEVDRERSILLGPVAWLSAETAGALDRQTLTQARCDDKRGFPATGVARENRPELFWSLSCALAPAVHRSVGGFDEGFRGWGAEDTDYGRRADAAGLALWKVAGAWAYHQFHEPMRRTRAQIAALAANAERFRDRWGDWPIPDVLGELAGQGHIRWTPSATEIRLTDGG